MGIAGGVTGNAIEASGGLILREDPRYFRVPDQPFKSSVENVVRLTFGARDADGGFRPAYARYMATLGSNFLSNIWRVRSEANAAGCAPARVGRPRRMHGGQCVRGILARR